MAYILENKKGRRLIRLNTDDIINIVREYQLITNGAVSYEQTRKLLNAAQLFLPEDMI